MQHKCTLLWRLRSSSETSRIYSHRNRCSHRMSQTQVPSRSKRNCTLLGSPTLRVLRTAYTCLAWMAALLRKSRCSCRWIARQKKLRMGGISHRDRWMLQYRPVIQSVIFIKHQLFRPRSYLWKNLFPEITRFRLIIQYPSTLSMYFWSTENNC